MQNITVEELKADAARLGFNKKPMDELIKMIEENKDDILDRLAENLLDQANGEFEMARKAANDGVEEVERLLVNHTEAV